MQNYVDRKEAAKFEEQVAKSLAGAADSAVAFQVYGVGGVGKSTLLERILATHKETVQWARVSFGDEDGLDEPISLMKKLYNRLEEASPTPNLLRRDLRQLKADPFLELYQRFFDAKHELLTRGASGRGAATKEDVAALRKLFSGGAKVAGGLVQAATTAGTGVPIPAAAVEKTATVAFEASTLVAGELDRAKQLVEQYAARKKDRALKELLLDPEGQLTAAFSEGLKRRAERKPVLLVLDTYEKASGVDTWLRRLLLQGEFRAAAVRWLIGGRYELGQQGTDWRGLQERGLVEDLLLRRFDEEQTGQFLKAIEITEPGEIQDLFQKTKGLPFFLNEFQRRRVLDLNVAADRLLLEALEPGEVAVVKALVCCRWFDQGVVDYWVAGKEATLGKRDWLKWLQQQYFVEPAPRGLRLKDVVRDVVREQFFGADRRGFQAAHGDFALFFEEEAAREVMEDEPISQCYENEEWRRARAEMLYHQVYSAKPEVRQVLLSHLLEARYLRQDRVVQEPILAGVLAEGELEQHPLLPGSLRGWLKMILPAVRHGWAVLEERPVDVVFNEERLKLSPAAVEEAWRACLERPLAEPSGLEGLAKFAALLFRAGRCGAGQQLDWLRRAQAEAEVIATQEDCEFTAGIFLWRLGNRFYDLESYEESIASYDKAIEFKPDKHEAWSNRGASLDSLGRYEEASASYDKAIEFKPDYHEAWSNRGVNLNSLGRYEEAIASCDKAIEFKPNYHEAWFNRGNSFDNLSRYDEAIASYDKAIEFKPDLHEAWSNRGVSLDNLGRYDDAIASYDKAIEFKPEQHEVWSNRGVSLSNLGRYDEAIASFDKAIEFKPDYHEAWSNRGNSLSNLGCYDDAIASFDKAIEFKPDYHEAWSNRGVSLSNLGRYDDASTSYDKAIEFKPDLHEVWSNRGVSLFNLGRYDDAIASYDKAIEITPNEPNSHYNKACCHALQSQADLALTNLTIAIELDPEQYRTLAQTDSDFATIRNDPRFQALIHPT